MKKPLLLIFLLLPVALLTSAYCQDSRITLSAEGGPSLTTFYRTKKVGPYYKPTLGGYAGFLAQFNLAPHISLRTGLTYERTGTNFKYDEYDMQSDCLYHFDYASIPVMARAEFGRKVRFYVNIGPYISYLVSQQYLSKEGSKYHDFTSQLSDDESVNANKLDFGIAGGMGIIIMVNKISALTLGVSDYLGLMDTKKQPDFYNELGQNLGFASATYNNAAIVVVGFSVMVGKSK